MHMLLVNKFPCKKNLNNKHIMCVKCIINIISAHATLFIHFKTNYIVDL